MNEQELRAVIREAVARHLGTGTPDAAPGAAGGPRTGNPGPRTEDQGPRTDDCGFSHSRYIHLVNVGDACLIEPAVTCNHCGYCLSHGH